VRPGAQISDRAAGWSFTAIGGLLLSATLAVAATRLVFLLHAKNAEATVIGDLVAPGRRGEVHCPVFSYTPAGTTHAPPSAAHAIDVESNRCRSGTGIPVGTKLQVLYDPAAPEEAVPQEGYALLLGLVASFSVMGLVFILSGLAFFRRHVAGGR
jgi:Protein of unknown function (DUF3592)